MEPDPRPLTYFFIKQNNLFQKAPEVYKYDFKLYATFNIMRPRTFLGYQSETYLKNTISIRFGDVTVSFPVNNKPVYNVSTRTTCKGAYLEHNIEEDVSSETWWNLTTFIKDTCDYRTAFATTWFNRCILYTEQDKTFSFTNDAGHDLVFYSTPMQSILVTVFEYLLPHCEIFDVYTDRNCPVTMTMTFDTVVMKQFFAIITFIIEASNSKNHIFPRFVNKIIAKYLFDDMDIVTFYVMYIMFSRCIINNESPSFKKSSKIDFLHTVVKIQIDEYTLEYICSIFNSVQRPIQVEDVD